MGFAFLLLTVLGMTAIADHAPRQWNASLNDPPNTRWAHIQEAYATEIHTLAKDYSKYVPKKQLEMYALMMSQGFLDKELEVEMKTLAGIADITYNEAAFLNLMYEFNAYCTSVIVQTQNGTIIHGRNLDYGLGALLRATVANVDVYRNGTLLFKMTWFPWYLGINTGLKPGKFSLSLNQRDEGSWAQNIAALVLGYKGNFFQARIALTNSNSYEEAVEYLSRAKTVAASYDIVAGPTTGVIITRNQVSIEPNVPLSEGGWYLVQTNHDWWTPDPVGDNRTAVAEAYLNEVGQEAFDAQQMFELLSQLPVLNPTTLFTVVMAPGTGYYEAVIRE